MIVARIYYLWKMFKSKGGGVIEDLKETIKDS